MMHGYTGAQPNPIVMNAAPANAVLCTGISIITIPNAINAVPTRIIVASENFIVMNPLAKRPAVMPIRNMLVNVAATSLARPSTPTMYELAHRIAVCSIAQ